MADLSSFSSSSPNTNPIGRPVINTRQADAIAPKPGRADAPERSGFSAGDRADISPEALKLSRASQSTEPFRASLVEQVRARIEDGSYETPDKIDAVIDRILTDFN